MLVDLTHVKRTICKLGVIYTVGHLLGFKAEHILLALRITAFKGMLLVKQKVTRIELDAGLIGINLHHSAALWLVNAHASRRHGVISLYEADAVIVTACKTERLIGKIEIATDGLGGGEIERRSCHGYLSTGGDQGIVGFKEALGIHPHLVVEYFTRCKTAQIEIRMIGKIENRLFIGGGSVRDAKLIVLGQLVDHVDGQSTGIALFSVGRDAGKSKLTAVRDYSRLGIPDLVGKSDLAAVKVVRAVVDKEIILFSVKGKLAAADSVAPATDKRTLIAVALYVVTKIVVSANDVGQLAASVGYKQLLNCTAKSNDANAHSTINGHGVKINVATTCCSEMFLFYIHIYSP